MSSKDQRALRDHAFWLFVSMKGNFKKEDRRKRFVKQEKDRDQSLKREKEQTKGAVRGTSGCQMELK